MSLRYLFGPVPRSFAEQKLHGPRQSGQCLTFYSEEGEGDVLIRPHDSWEDVLARLPNGWTPDLLALWLPYITVPNCLWSAPVPRLGLAPDWNLMWHYYRRRLSACNWGITDTLGAELLNRAGLDRVRPGNLCGCDRVFVETTWPQRERDIDVLMVGNFNPAVQRERLPWLRRLARLGLRWKVVCRAGVFGDNYRHLLARSRIVFHASARRKVGPRAFEAAAAGALIFQERDNRELPGYFRDRQECVFYADDEAEQLLDYYLEREDERRTLAEAARSRAEHYRFEDFWVELLATIESELSVDGRGNPRLVADANEELLTRCRQALRSSRFEDTLLIADLEKASAAQPKSALLHNALGVMLGRQSQDRGSWQAAAELAVECFRRALECQSDYVLAGLNLAEARAAAGQKLAAVETARRTLELLQHAAGFEPRVWDGLLWGRGFELFAVEWERAAWSNAGRPDAENHAKQVLLRWRLHSLLAGWSGELIHAYQAAFLRPDLTSTRTSLGMALLRADRPVEAVEHLRAATAGNPLDRIAARGCSQALAALGDRQGQQRLLEEQALLSRICPTLAPVETWFAPPRPKGNELVSIIVLCCNQLEYTRSCLESLLRHTRSPYELILADNGSTDDTPQYLEEIRRHAGSSRVEIIRNAGNAGFAAGCNQGLKRAQGRSVVFLNNDTILTPDWLQGLIDCCLRQWPAVGLVGPVSNAAMDAQGIRVGYTNPDDVDDFAARRRRTFAGKSQIVPRLGGFCLLVRREVLDCVGGLDERYGLGFFEDDDLCVRARDAGFRLSVALDTFIHHFGNRTFQHLGMDTRERLQSNFELFRARWGPEYATGYHLPAPPPQNREDPPGKTGTDVVAATPAVEWVDTGVRVSLCMIVRNEEHHLPDCLHSVQGLFDDIVVADTGSTDDTRRIAEKFGARVVDFPWPDSFGAARNESLRHARGKWILWLDADDRLDAENRRKLETVLAGLGDELDAYALKVRSVLDARRSSFRLLDQVRLFRNLPSIRWDYRIHEQILPSVNRVGGVVRWADVIVDHVGYMDPSARRGKLERNLRLLEMDYAERADDGFNLFNLGWTLLDLDRGEEALTHLRRSLEQTRPSSSTLRKLHHLLALAYHRLGRREEALAACREGLKRFALDAELLNQEGLLLRDAKDFLGAERSWLSLLDARRGQYFASEETGLRGYRTRQLLAEVYRCRERFLEAEVQWRAALLEKSDFEPARVGLAELYLGCERWSELDYFLEQLESQGTDGGKVGWLRARGQVRRREFSAARRTLEHVIAQDPHVLGPRVLLSQVLLQEERDWVAAERALRAVLELAPNHAETRHNLSVLQRRLHREAAVSKADGASGAPASAGKNGFGRNGVPSPKH